MNDQVVARAERHAALGDPVRLAIIDELASSDRAPVELQSLTQLPSNLLAHHLDVLERVGLVSRHRSSGDGRRRYVHLETTAFSDLTPGVTVTVGRALFVCTHNSARSQLAAALWEHIAASPAISAGTHPAGVVHPGAVASAQRAGLDLSTAQPRNLSTLKRLPALVITVCDRAHEELSDHPDWLHWSIPDPIPTATKHAFDTVRDALADRIRHLTGIAS